MKAWRLELLFDLHWVSQDMGLVRAGVGVRSSGKQWHVDGGGLEMDTCRSVVLLANEIYVL